MSQFRAPNFTEVFEGDAEEVLEFLNDLDYELEASNITENQMKIATFLRNIRGSPASWFRAYRNLALTQKKPEMLIFDNLIVAFKKSYGLDASAIYEKWAELRQTGSLQSYTDEFLTLLGAVSKEGPLPSHIEAYAYTKGLKNPSKQLVRTKNPSTLIQAIEYAAASTVEPEKPENRENQPRATEIIVPHTSYASGVEALVIGSRIVNGVFPEGSLFRTIALGTGAQRLEFTENILLVTHY
ncbi:LAFA_0E03730g1_1 [Lachancea sp. 'fantastica']|nr:LAFA_0E03730g1_1 [Lachancea sp. 'fantastica']